MTKVVFNRVDEFLAEVEREAAGISILRITYLTESIPALPGTRRLSICSGFMCRGLIVELKEHIGDLFEGDVVPDKGKAVMKAIEEKAQSFELDLRAGRFEA